MKVSFDYDDTLSIEFVQSYAELLVSRGIDVWIVTARHADGKNGDIYNTAGKLGIPKERIVFTDMKPKATFFKGSNFIWHLDDRANELTAINNNTNVKGVWVLDDRTWMGTCERLIKYHQSSPEL